MFVNDVANNCFQVTLNDLTGKFVSENFHAHKGILGAHGAVHVSMDQTHMTFGFRPTTQTLEDGRVVPGVESCNFGWDLNKGNLGFKVSGSFWDGFVDMFKNLFEDNICDAVIAKVRDELTVAIPADINKMLATTDGKAQLKPFTNWFFDFETEEAGYVDTGSINLGAKGILYDSDIGEVLPDTFPAMPYKDPAIPSAAQVFVSQESVSSLLTSFLQVHPIDGWFNSTMVPSTAKFQLTTGFLNKAFKGISDYYGTDAPVNVQYNLLSLHDFAVKASSPDLTLFGDIGLKFYVDGVNGTELAVDLDVHDFEFQGQVKVVNETQLETNITKLHVKKITVNSCSFGEIGTFKLQMGLNVALAVAAPTIAGKIDKISLPEKVLGYFEISDIGIYYYDGYLGVGATPTFIAPPLPPPTPDSIEASTVCVENRAGFVLKWKFNDQYTTEDSEWTEHYPVLKTHCMDIKTMFPNIREGEMVQTVIKASAGKTKYGQHLTIFKDEPGLFTTFTCRGTTLHYHCDDEWLGSQENDFSEAQTGAELLAAFFQ